MIKDNENALRCAIGLEVHPFREVSEEEKRAAAHLRRLTRENEAKDALLRQAVDSLSPWGCEESNHTEQYAALAAIRQHLEGRA